MALNDRIARNTTYLSLASIVQKVISFGYYAYLANAIGDANIGIYSTALKFTSIFIIFMDFGLGPLLTREVSKDESRLQEYVQRIFTIKTVLIVFSLIALFVSIHVENFFVTNVTEQDVRLVYIGAAIIVLDTVTFTFLCIFRALKQLLWESIGIILYQIVILAAGITVLKLHLSLGYVLSALLLASAVQCLYLFVLVRWKTQVRFRFHWNWADARSLLMVAAPFAIAGVIYRLTGSIDGLMLKAIAGNTEAGWYDLAFKLSFALTVLPGSFATIYFPAMSAYFKHEREKLHTAFEGAVSYMLLLSIPIAAAVFVLGDNIILTVWNKNNDFAWANSIVPLLIFMIGLPFVFLNYPVGNFLNAVNKQKLNTFNMFISLIVNVALNIILIPYYSYIGAAIAAVSSSILLVALGLPWVYRIAPFSVYSIFQKTLRILIASGMMAFVLFFIQDNYSLPMVCMIGALIFFVGAFLVGAITRDESMQLKRALLKRTQRV